MRNNVIMTLDLLKNESKKIARLSGNRDLNEKIVKAKMKSLEQYGQLMPAVVVDATDAINQGLEVVDFVTGNVVGKEEAVNYLVLVDANHRYEAHCRLLKENEKLDEPKYRGEFYLMYALNTELEIAKMLSEINISTNPWRGGDYAKGAKMSNLKKELPLLDAINDLVNEGYNLSVASKWLTFTANIDKKVMNCAMDNIILPQLENTVGLERGQRLIEAAKEHFTEKNIKSRYLIDWIISKYNTTGDKRKPDFTDKMERFLRSISKEDADYIKKAKGKTGGDTKENLINLKLTELWNGFER